MSVRDPSRPNDAEPIAGPVQPGAVGTPEQPTTVARGAAYGLVADAAMVVSALAVSVLVARFLGPVNRGVYFLALLVATLIALFGDLGLSTSGLVFAANRRVPLPRLHGIALVFCVASTAVGAILLFGFKGTLITSVLKGIQTSELWLVVVAIGPLLYAQIVGAMLTGLGRIPVLSMIRLGASVAAPVVMVPALIVSGGTAFAAVAAWAVVTVLTSFAVAVEATRLMGAPTGPTRRDLRTVMGFGLKAYVGTLSHHGFLRFDVLFISARLGPGAVGQYSLSSVLAERISLVGSAMYSASASRVGAGDIRAAHELTARLVRLLLLALVPIGLLLALLAPTLIPLVFGADFQPAVEPFILLLPGTIALTLWYVLGLYLVAALERPGLTTGIQASAMLVSLPLYWLAVREWGMTGAAVVSSAIYGSVMLLGAIVFYRHRIPDGTGLIPRRRDVREAVAMVRRAARRTYARARHA